MVPDAPLTRHGIIQFVGIRPGMRVDILHRAVFREGREDRRVLARTPAAPHRTKEAIGVRPRVGLIVVEPHRPHINAKGHEEFFGVCHPGLLHQRFSHRRLSAKIGRHPVCGFVGYGVQHAFS